MADKLLYALVGGGSIEVEAVTDFNLHPTENVLGNPEGTVTIHSPNTGEIHIIPTRNILFLKVKHLEKGASHDR